MAQRRFVAAVFAVVFLVLPARAQVRPISGAERAAVEIAAAYLSGGPAAIVDRLVTSSPLARMSRIEQLAELEVRLGPPASAQWELQTIVPALADKMAAFTVTYPAGFEDHVLFDMASEGGVYKLREARFLAQPSPRKPLFAREPEAPAGAPNEVPAPLPLRGGAVTAGLLASALAVAAALTARKRGFARALLTASIVLVAAASLLGVSDQHLRRAAVAPAAVVVRDEGPARLAPLLSLRRALADGSGNVDATYLAVDRGQGRGAIADLWKIQSDMQTQTSVAKTALARFKAPSDRPLAEMLRARIALLENDEVAAVLALEQAVNLGPGRDALWFENADLLYSLGFEDRAKVYYERLERIGSRDADAYYALATLAAADNKEEKAEKYLRQAWDMRPVERAQLIGNGLLWWTLRRPGMLETISLSAAREPLVLSSATSTQPATLPADAQPRTWGDLLQIAIGRQQLTVPGGAMLAPPNTPLVEANASSADEENQRLADFPALLSVGRNPAAYAQPALRQRLTGTAAALANRNRWTDLVQLTEGLSPASEHVPANIFFLRSIGLQRMQRHEDAKRLLTQVAASPVLQRRRDAGALTQLAELFASHDLYDAAVRMYDRAQSIRSNPFVDDRVRQIMMNKRLATKYSTHTTPHFEVHFPEDVNLPSAIELGEVLEREFKRLQTWIPTPNFQRVVVNVVWWQEFRSTYTGSDFILGFYNGKITVPFAGISAEIPQITAILAHELAHAMIAQATADQAPRWFQEGFAQRIEQRPYYENAFNMYDDSKLLALPLLDAVMYGSPDPEMISAAYIISQTNIRFFEAKYGRASLQKLMAAFRDGADTEEAIRRVCGKSLAAVEDELRQWGRSEQRVFEGGA